MEYKVVCNLSTFMGKANCNIQDIRDGTNLDRNTISGLKNNTIKRIDLATISKLCKFFIDKKVPCTPGDLFELVELKEEDQ